MEKWLRFAYEVVEGMELLTDQGWKLVTKAKGFELMEIELKGVGVLVFEPHQRVWTNK